MQMMSDHEESETNEKSKEVIPMKVMVSAPEEKQQQTQQQPLFLWDAQEAKYVNIHNIHSHHITYIIIICSFLLLFHPALIFFLPLPPP
jgi:hypothetical protein